MGGDHSHLQRHRSTPNCWETAVVADPVSDSFGQPSDGDYSIYRLGKKLRQGTRIRNRVVAAELYLLPDSGFRRCPLFRASGGEQRAGAGLAAGGPLVII